MIQNWLVTGASRGIGRELVNILSKEHNVFAGVRTLKDMHAFEKTCDLEDCGQMTDGKNIIPVYLDLQDKTSICLFRDQLMKNNIKLDGIINNAGILIDPPNTGVLDIDDDIFMETMKVNVLGPIRVLKYLNTVLVEDNPYVINISAIVASITMGITGFGRCYPMSKTALNMFTRLASKDMPNACIVSLHPGWVKTTMGGEKAPLEPYTAATNIYNCIRGLTKENSGSFINSMNNKVLNW